MAKIKLDPDLIIHYSDLNPQGHPVVLLLHGLGANGDSWFFQFEALVEAGFRVLVPDLRGFGRSSYPGDGCNPHIMAEDIAKILSRLNIPSAIIIGISMGGTVALELVLNHPSLVQSLVLVNTFSKLRPKNSSYLFLSAFRYFLVLTLGIPAQARYVVARLFPNDDQEYLRNSFYDQITQANPSGYRTTMRSLAKFNMDGRLNEINVPTLVVTGENDSIVEPAIQSRMAQNIPEAKHVVIKDADHAVIVEKPEKFNQTVLNFLI
jgi:pimeloyl-ACP methyl ester carboxylesterase